MRGPAVDRLRTFAALAAVIIVCVALRIAAIPTVETPRHDDAISYLAATGHQREHAIIVWRPTPPYATWATAADWQRLWVLDHPFCFARIARDLGLYDIHPPLYFWLLHLWLVAVGVTARAGPTLNLLLSVVTLLLVYRLGRDVADSPAAGIIAALVWGASRATLAITLAARPYELVALLGTTFLWQMLRISDPGRQPAAREPALLALTVTAGVLTHYHFALLLVASTIASWWRLEASPSRRRLMVPAASATGFTAALIIHPWILAGLRRSEDRAEFEWATVPARAAEILDNLTEFGGHDWGVKTIWVLALVSAGATLLRAGRASGRQPTLRRSAIDAFLVILAMLVFLISALFLLLVSPSHAMGWRYLSLVWPVLAVLVGTLLWRSAPGRALAVILCVVLVESSLSWLRYGARDDVVVPDPRRPLLVDDAGAGVLVPVLWHMRPETPVFAAFHSDLSDHPAAWLDGLGDRASYAATVIDNPSRPGKRDRLLASMGPRYEEEGDRRRSHTVEWIALRRRHTGASPQPPDPAADSSRR
jgi:hypothetical protein